MATQIEIAERRLAVHQMKKQGMGISAIRGELMVLGYGEVSEAVVQRDLGVVAKSLESRTAAEQDEIVEATVAEFERIKAMAEWGWIGGMKKVEKRMIRRSGKGKTLGDIAKGSGSEVEIVIERDEGRDPYYLKLMLEAQSAISRARGVDRRKGGNVTIVNNGTIQQKTVVKQKGYVGFSPEEWAEMNKKKVDEMDGEINGEIVETIAELAEQAGNREGNGERGTGDE